MTVALTPGPGRPLKSLFKLESGQLLWFQGNWGPLFLQCTVQYCRVNVLAKPLAHLFLK